MTLHESVVDALTSWQPTDPAHDAVRHAVLDLRHHPEAQSVEVRPHDLEIYDELAHPQHNDDSKK